MHAIWCIKLYNYMSICAEQNLGESKSHYIQYHRISISTANVNSCYCLSLRFLDALRQRWVNNIIDSFHRLRMLQVSFVYI